ncbi:hypothetical protein Ciccas_005907 [Cichlidogyrus casuarinus]|uniref:Uncharacterized protein n=1 Tax=Cichlidogyrus casuarinus TaxID=1844966 RepID=A0ABD2Q7D5_9PLAT
MAMQSFLLFILFFFVGNTQYSNHHPISNLSHANGNKLLVIKRLLVLFRALSGQKRKHDQLDWLKQLPKSSEDAKFAIDGKTFSRMMSDFYKELTKAYTAMIQGFSSYGSSEDTDSKKPKNN